MNQSKHTSVGVCVVYKYIAECEAECEADADIIVYIELGDQLFVRPYTILPIANLATGGQIQYSISDFLYFYKSILPPNTFIKYRLANCQPDTTPTYFVDM